MYIHENIYTFYRKKATLHWKFNQKILHASLFMGPQMLDSNFLIAKPKRL